MRQLAVPTWWLFVRFEQGRGRGGVPKVCVPYSVEGDRHPSVEALTRMAVQMLRVMCADSIHGRDLMPGRDDEYRLHNIDGGMIAKSDEIRWEKIDGSSVGQVAEVVLTWRIPNEDLLGGGQSPPSEPGKETT